MCLMPAVVFGRALAERCHMQEDAATMQAHALDLFVTTRGAHPPLAGHTQVG
jgi:hypothetical protein